MPRPLETKHKEARDNLARARKEVRSQIVNVHPQVVNVYPQPVNIRPQVADVNSDDGQEVTERRFQSLSPKRTKKRPQTLSADAKF